MNSSEYNQRPERISLSPLGLVLDLWRDGAWSDEDVVVWAEARIAEVSEPSDMLIELALHGPEVALQDSYLGWPIEQWLNCAQGLAVRFHRVDWLDPAQEEALLHWFARNCFCDPSKPDFLDVGYYLDHLAYECDDMPAAISYLRERRSFVQQTMDEAFVDLMEPVANHIDQHGMPRRLQ